MTMPEPDDKLTARDFQSDQDVRWCPGCGDYSILANIQRVMPELGIPRENFVFVSGIGCSSRFPYYMNTYGMHTIHGRAPAFATGVKCSRPELSVWVVTGDGDGLSIGGNHLLHAIRRNVDLQILLFNNRIYGLTKGQYSPTSRVGMRSKSTPEGSIDHPVDPISFALGAGATFVARTVDVNAAHLQQVLKRAHAHRGTAFVEILQNCPVYNDDEWIEVEDRKQRVDAALVLEDGQPLVWGAEPRRRGIRIRNGIASVVPLAEGDDPVAKGVAVHRERYETPAYAFVLASLVRPDFPIPIGVFRATETSTYERTLDEQVSRAIQARGPGSLESLLNAGDTWTVEG
ncbi:MAG: 2-oxoacid:ferredoxin oxidoreductase subunit beta [Myxococcales bacterium]|nr:2-oxoacid:ferredoxin oxidoreductase subunit beta [Myxococcales bacterium]MDH5565580.1 2-oxoacid:ferredoxin oxidoreductase subunit beta [Myxococcales bacterium]